MPNWHLERWEGQQHKISPRWVYGKRRCYVEWPTAMVFDALDRGNLLPSGILPAESEFDSMRYVSRLIERAQFEIVLIDPYSDAATLEVLSNKRPGVKVRLVCKDRGKPTPTEIAKFNRQYKGFSNTLKSSEGAF